MATRNLLLGLLMAIGLGGCGQGAGHPWPNSLLVLGNGHDSGEECRAGYRMVVVRNAVLPLCKESPR